MGRSLTDLHRHLDGSLRPETLRELAAVEGVPLPLDIRFQPEMGLDQALERFAVTLAVLQAPAAVCRVAAEICEDAAREGVSTLEIRFAPHLHRGATPDEIVDAAQEGVAGRAGLILCALYGDPPSLVEELVDLAAVRPAVVGIDLAGTPQPSHEWSMSDYKPVFRRAAELGIGRTVHAGEGGPPEEIRQAILELEAQRIGHGTTLLEDENVLALVIERGVVIEACPTSNLHTGAISDVTEHPLPRWLARGVTACINTDNTLLSDVDAPTEYARVAEIPGMSYEAVESCLETGRAAAFRRS